MAVRSSSATYVFVRRVSTTSTPGSLTRSCSSRSAMSSTSSASFRPRTCAPGSWPPCPGSMTTRDTPSPSWRDSEKPPRLFAAGRDGGAGADDGAGGGRWRCGPLRGIDGVRGRCSRALEVDDDAVGVVEGIHAVARRPCRSNTTRSRLLDCFTILACRTTSSGNGMMASFERVDRLSVQQVEEHALGGPSTLWSWKTASRSNSSVMRSASERTSRRMAFSVARAPMDSAPLRRAV